MFNPLIVEHVIKSKSKSKSINHPLAQGIKKKRLNDIFMLYIMIGLTFDFIAYTHATQ